MLALLLSPLALYGLIHNALPYYLPRLFVRPYRDRPEIVGTVKMAVGGILFPLSYLILTGIALRFLSLPSALLYGLSLPLSGLFVLFYQEQVLRNWPLWRLVLRRRYGTHLRRLSEERAGIIRDLDRVKESYLAIRKGSKPCLDVNIERK